MAKKNKNHSTPVESIRHKDKRKNIPTEELRDFVAEEEQAPKSVLYPRDPSLDPQLVWQGKDEQDREDLAVPVVPIYIQEKIHPQAIIDDLPRAEQTGDRQLDLFADFNGLPEEFDQRVDFYHHDGHWSNRMILGDSLLVMTSLAEKEGLKGKVQCIYIDPPYGIKFGSNWQISTRKRDVKDGKAEDASRQPEQVRAFRDTWKLGIHSYLAYLRDRLVTARELLTETGSVFVQIGDENLHLVRCLMDEVFGSENFVLSIVVKKKGATTPTDPVNDYLIWFAKSREGMKVRQLCAERSEPEDDPKFNTLISRMGEKRRVVEITREEVRELVAAGWRWARVNYPIVSQHPHERRGKDFSWKGKPFSCGNNAQWRFDVDIGMPRLALSDRLFDGGGASLGGILFWQDWPYVAYSNIWDDLHGEQDIIYVVQTNRKIVERCLLMTTEPGDLVLDPTCGSGTTAYVAEQWGRRWITCDTSRVALALARTRLMAARYPYYLLADSPAGVQKEAELTGKMPPPHKTEGDIRQGFVYQRVRHFTLKAIANNEEIDAIHAAWQEKSEPLRDGLNKLLKKKWQEWEVPREPEKDWPADAKKLLKQWWETRRGQQREIDDSNARRAETATLYDQPCEDKKTVRVSGPFTVESLSPHRTISVEEKRQRSEVGKNGWKMKVIGPDCFATMILDNLRKAGVQNTIKGERLKFDSLDPFAGEWIHAQGQYTEKPTAGGKSPHPNPLPEGEGTSRRAAICIGPEHGTVGAQLIKEAAKEAVRGVGFDVLLVCGFAFDPSVSEEAKRYGRLTVLPVRMNPDLAMGDELLKKTGAGNLFMVFGEPDVDIKKQKDGKLTVAIKGVDVYDPTTGQIRNSSTDDIACWFIDTDYNGESFFVRHAYFTGAEEPYEKLKRALRAEIDEAAWSALYSTTSRPFDRPETGKIAVKVINHYGDEVLKVYEI